MFVGTELVLATGGFSSTIGRNVEEGLVIVVCNFNESRKLAALGKAFDDNAVVGFDVLTKPKEPLVWELLEAVERVGMLVVRRGVVLLEPVKLAGRFCVV